MLLLLLPLRIPVACDLASALSDWLEIDDDDASERLERPEFTAADCADDIEYLAKLRQTIETRIFTHEDASNNLELLQEYAAVLHEFQTRGFPATDFEGEGLLALPWRTSEPCGLMPHTETHSNLAWERANVLWNIASVHIYKATRQYPPTSRMEWTKAGVSLQNAASIIKYIRERVLSKEQPPLHTSLAFSHTFLQLYETFCLAEAQRTAFVTFSKQPRPKHFMLAKLAAAAAPLYSDVEDLCQEDARFQDMDLLMDWEDYVRAWGMWMAAIAEYHQATVHGEKKEYGIELARLEGAFKFASFCKEFIESAQESKILEELAQEITPMLDEMDERFETAGQENQGKYKMEIPELDELPEIAPQLSVKTESDISKLLPASTKPLFVAVTDPALRKYVEMFRSATHEIVTQTQQRADEETQNARNALAAVHLPHSLTAFRQEQSGGGIPETIWQRIEIVQAEKQIEGIQQELRNIQALASKARKLFGRVDEILEVEFELDNMFRGQNPNFEGHSVKDIQKPFRQALRNYQQLIDAAHESDILLARRCEMLEKDPKFRLLTYPKSQLDRMVPPASSSRSGNHGDIDVSALSKKLVELSTLFNERESLIHSLKEKWKTYNIVADLSKVQVDPSRPGSSEEQYQNVIEDSKASFYDIANDLEANFEHQTNILNKIMQENAAFMRRREQLFHQQTVKHSSDSTLGSIEDALEEIAQLTKHLKEGGAFYEVVIPKLEKLKQQVEEVGSRLAQERSNYEDYSSRIRSSDAMDQSGMSDRYANETAVAYGGGSGRNGGFAARNSNYVEPSRARVVTTPGAQSIRNGRAEARVDDEMFANLVAMDFDPNRVVAALKRHDNNFDAALNDLLFD
jgi:hypothetical protein